MLRVAVVGSRGFGTVHLAALSYIREQGFPVEFYTFSSDLGEARKLAERFGAAGYFTSYNEALSSAIDVVDLVVSHDAHADMALRAMKAGKHVLLEKPIARNLEEAKEIVSTSERLGLKLMVAENYHFDRTFTALYGVVGSLGRPHTIVVRDLRFSRPGGWRASAERMGGGAIIDGGVHMLHVMLNLGGDYEAVCSSVYRTGLSGIEGEDVGLAVFRFRDGLRGVYMYGWAFMQAPPSPIIEVYGERGSVYEDPGSRVWVERRGVRYLARHGDLVLNGQRVQVGEGDAMVDEIRGFLEAVDRGSEVPMSPYLAVRDLKAVLDIYSASSRC